MKTGISLAIFMLLASTSIQHSKEEWKSRSIYQLLTDRFQTDDGSAGSCDNLRKYCGGTWKGIESKLDYIKGMGFDAIWISPIPENNGDNYHGYAALNWYKSNPHFGDDHSLQSLVNTAHSKGMWVMLDVVANHVAQIDMAFDQVYPFNDASHYHDKCEISHWDNPQEVEYCRMANLPDLNQDNPWVRSQLLQWVKWAVSKFNFDGIRVDTVPHVKNQFWKEYAQAAGIFSIGEASNGQVSFIAQYANSGLDSTLNYPLYYVLRDVFNFKYSMYGLKTLVDTEQKLINDPYALGNFIDNHDTARFLSVSHSQTLLKAALAFNFLSPGIPILYYGTEQAFSGENDPFCREPLWISKFNTTTDLYKYIGKLNALRKQFQIWMKPHVERWIDDKFYAFSRGDVLVALSNDDTGIQTRLITYHPFKAGAKVCNILWPTDCVVITSDNKLQVTLNYAEVKIFTLQSAIVDNLSLTLEY
ncbi:alpha catalytic domain containing protein [Stylonychia lemnae]|uniref:alpha-amylase n=1 Tax=Stylonychia lemnae TaxID=5949 RepID=A0A078AXN0_STYLE|nr:alpha catalytic domain containing protein [Stylonychia lemnae]|eukprot:CDW86894.1 alpha catalytic domain containing protein [Stylonychia lemnae]